MTEAEDRKSNLAVQASNVIPASKKEDSPYQGAMQDPHDAVYEYPVKSMWKTLIYPLETLSGGHHGKGDLHKFCLWRATICPKIGSAGLESRLYVMRNDFES